MSTGLTTDADRPQSSLRPRGTSFAGLVGVELRRLWWRRLAKAVALGVVVFVGVATFAVYSETRPEAIAQRVDEYNRAVTEMKQSQAQMTDAEKAAQLAGCKRDEAQSRANGDAAVDFQCERMFQPPPPEAFGLVNTARWEVVRGISQSGAYAFGFLAFLLGASFIAAEFASGSMGNWLTFQPNRLRVGSAKLVAATGAGIATGVLGVGLAALGATLVTTINRPGSGMAIPDAPVPMDDPVAQALLRVVVAVAVGGLGGAVIGLLVRSTAGVIGLVVGYTVIIEGFLASAFGDGRLQPWFLRLNLEAFLQKGATYQATTCGSNGCTFQTFTNSYTHGWVTLLVVTVVGVVASLLVFRRRDVS